MNRWYLDAAISSLVSGHNIYNDFVAGIWTQRFRRWYLDAATFVADLQTIINYFIRKSWQE